MVRLRLDPSRRAAVRQAFQPDSAHTQAVAPSSVRLPSLTRIRTFKSVRLESLTYGKDLRHRASCFAARSRSEPVEVSTETRGTASDPAGGCRFRTVSSFAPRTNAGFCSRVAFTSTPRERPVSRQSCTDKRRARLKRKFELLDRLETRNTRAGHALQPVARWPPESAQVSAFARFDGLTAGGSTGSPRAARQARRRPFPEPVEAGDIIKPGVQTPGKGARSPARAASPFRQDCLRPLTTPSAREGSRLRCMSFHPCALVTLFDQHRERLRRPVELGLDPQIRARSTRRISSRMNSSTSPASEMSDRASLTRFRSGSTLARKAAWLRQLGDRGSHGDFRDRSAATRDKTSGIGAV